MLLSANYLLHVSANSHALKGSIHISKQTDIRFALMLLTTRNCRLYIFSLLVCRFSTCHWLNKLHYVLAIVSGTFFWHDVTATFNDPDPGILFHLLYDVSTRRVTDLKEKRINNKRVVIWVLPMMLHYNSHHVQIRERPQRKFDNFIKKVNFSIQYYHSSSKKIST